jgi:hypothetical protein
MFALTFDRIDSQGSFCTLSITGFAINQHRAAAQAIAFLVGKLIDTKHYKQIVIINGAVFCAGNAARNVKDKHISHSKLSMQHRPLAQFEHNQNHA